MEEDPGYELVVDRNFVVVVAATVVVAVCWVAAVLELLETVPGAIRQRFQYLVFPR